MPKRTGEPPHHNTLYCYTDFNCRQPECVERKNAWQRTRRTKHREGQPALINAQPVRQHILTLQAAGISAHRIALLAGVGDWTVRDLLPTRTGSRPRKYSVSPETAQKILAVTVDTAAPSYTDSTGTRRRIQALTGAGWTLRAMAKQIGLHPRYLSDLVRREGRPVYTVTADKVARGYEQLKTQRPARRGVDPRAIQRNRKKAAQERWPTPDYWDQYPDCIDDPDFEPLYGVTKREIVAQDANWIMRTSGLNKAATAQRLGVDKSYLDHAFRDHPEYAIEVAA